MLPKLPSHPPFSAAPLLFAILLSYRLSEIAAESQQIARPGCPSTCGDLEIPFPFGIGAECAKEGFEVNCNHTFTPPRAYLNNGSAVELLNISLLEGQVRVGYYQHSDCYRKDGSASPSPSPNGSTTAWAGGESGSPYTFSSQRNRFTAIGCDTYASIMSPNPSDFTGGCSSICSGPDRLVNGSCSGLGCCQTAIPTGLKRYEIRAGSFHNHTHVWGFNPCSFAFLVEQDWFAFSVEDLTSKSRFMSTGYQVPVVLDWVAGNESCDVARKDPDKFACRSANSICYDSTSSATGYLCNCSSGYEGNPYLAGGCQDIDECKRPQTYPCDNTCSNLPGSYKCSCSNGSYDCDRHSTSVKLIIVTTILFVMLPIMCFYGFFENKRRDKRIKQLYQQNGGAVLESHLFTHRDIQSRFKIFTKEELEKATNKFDDRLVLGCGGQGKVYKGTLPDGTSIAIKKSMEINDTKNDSFVNEIIILSQVYHPNVVKLMGCCLEVATPYLVYEFVPNKTLFDHIHIPGLPWEKRLRIAASAAGALAYLHTIGICHQDVKSMNILLTMDFKAKISDFGLSRLIRTDDEALNTLVQGTLGYLDPEFVLSYKLTSKSDVFSFGVVLAELLTGKVPLSHERSERERSLANHFKLSMEENQVFDILDQQIVVATPDVRRQVMEVAKLANHCLNMKGKYRPDMMDVFQVLEKLWKSAYLESVENGNDTDMNGLLDKQEFKILDYECEESGFLFSGVRSHHSATFDIENGR